MKLLKKIPFFLFLLVLFFCLHGLLENYGNISAGELTGVGLVALGCILLLYLLSRLASKNYLLASLVTFFIGAWYLFFGAIHDSIKAISFLRFLQSYTILLPVLLLTNIAVIWWLKRNKQVYNRLFLYLNILFIIFCVADGALLVNKHYTQKNSSTQADQLFDISKVKAKPNVYLLVFDCYAGYKSLQDSFAFKNDSLYDFLAQRSFKVLPAFSNYNFTFFSMASLLNMQYITDDYTNKIAVQSDMQKRVREIKNAEVFTIFNSMGYSVENYSIFDIKDKPGISGNNSIIPMHAYLVTNKIFHNRLVLDLGYLLYNFNYFARKHIFEHDDDNKASYNKLMATIEKKAGPPKMVYAHLLLPHAPYFKDSLGKYLPIKDFNTESKEHYLSYLKYSNTVIRSVITKITAGDPAAVVLLMSDHGYNNKGSVRISDSAQIAAERYSFNNICAVRFPNGQHDSIAPAISNVNIFRYLFNAQFQQKMPYLKDSMVWVNHD